MVRRFLSSGFATLPPLEKDPVVELFGTFRGGEPEDSERHDDVIYAEPPTREPEKSDRRDA